MLKSFKLNYSVNIIIIFGIALLLLEDLAKEFWIVNYIVNTLDYIIYFLYSYNVIITLINCIRNKKNPLFRIIETLFLIILIGLFLFNEFYYDFTSRENLQYFYTRIIFIRNIFIIIRMIAGVDKLNLYLKKLTSNPAQAIIFSFLIVIIAGTILLMTPYATRDGSRIGLVNALFTSTSAVCVTGLIVLDTGSTFSIFGQSVIMILFQIGGLGLMILSYFAAFIIGKKMTLEDKLTLSYLINENDTRKISAQLRFIILIAFIVELAGVTFLFVVFNKSFDNPVKALFYSFFHAISAFCNAGFSLFSDSFEGYRSNILLNFTVCFLIIIGGLSFGVLTNFIRHVRSKIRKYWLKKEGQQIQLTLNTKIVLIITSFLIITGLLIIYQLEHEHLVKFDLKTQYLSAFFQSVTLRTAGFNSINFGILNNFTYFIMIFFMIIGGASGSTAGGVKVNTVGIIFAYIKSIIKGEKNTTLMKRAISVKTVNNAFLIVTLYLISIFFGTLLISISDNKDFVKTIFEVVSAIGTVGLSAGITSSLTTFAKIIIIILMFFGRIGPLTLLTALEQRTKSYEIKYPEEYISIG